jgi:hypothetical protein
MLVSSVHPSITLGIFGSYEFYQDFTSVRMLPLARMRMYMPLIMEVRSRGRGQRIEGTEGVQVLCTCSQPCELAPCDASTL